MRSGDRALLVAAMLAVPGCSLVGYPNGAASPPGPVLEGSGRPTDDPAGSAAGSAAEAPAVVRAAPDFRRDRPPTDPPDVDLDAIPDAVPRAEPASRYGNRAQYEVFGRVYRTLDTSQGYEEEGVASWYGEEFHGRSTSSGEPYDMYAMTAAHRSLPLPSYLEVTNLNNGRTVVVRVNDRGPFHGDRLIDVSYAAAHRLGMIGPGTARVRVRALQPEG